MTTEPPLAAAPVEAHRPSAVASAGSPASAPRRSSGPTATRKPHVRKLLLGAAIAAPLALAVGIAAATGGSKPVHTQRPSGPSAEDLADTAANDRCASLWNSEKNSTAKSMITSQLQFSSSYVSVGAAADYPDKCLITVSFPDNDAAYQFFETDNDPINRPFVSTNLVASALDESVKDWNASLDDQAALTVN